MPNAYNATAKEIIKSSIRSAIFIDDNLGVPFKSNQSLTNVQISRALYNSFIKNSVSIDFYKYSPRKDWKKSKDFLFKDRDLVVLDWQLENNEYEENTLEILKNAVGTPSLHFICIYTSKRANEFDDIAYGIKAYFSEYNNDFIKLPTNQIIQFLDNELPEGITQEIKNKLQSHIKEFSLFNSLNLSSKYEKLKHDLIALLGNDCYDLLQGELCKQFKLKTYAAFEAFGFGINEEFLSDSQLPITMNFYMDKRFIVINNTIILMTNKSDPRPASLYSYFTEAVLKYSGNFLSLLSLDLKNMLRDSSGFISQELEMIDEVAFFHHKDTIQPKEAFFDFVLELWKSNLASILYSQNDLIKLFNETTLESYRKTKSINAKLKKFKKRGNTALDNDLAKLNYYYNILENRNLEDFLRFGDIFNIVDDKNSATAEYLLCITAHCDCLHSENIKNQYFFVRGRVIANAIGLIEGDSGNNSFIRDAKRNINCIAWSHKPFTIYLDDNKILKNTHTVNIGKNAKRVVYISTLKENYTQRIANHAFSHPMRVGIFFAKKDS